MTVTPRRSATGRIRSATSRTSTRGSTGSMASFVSPDSIIDRSSSSSTSWARWSTSRSICEREVAGGLRVVDRTLRQRLGQQLDRGQRGAQLMADVGHEVAPDPLGAALAGGLVQRDDQARARQRHGLDREGARAQTAQLRLADRHASAGLRLAGDAVQRHRCRRPRSGSCRSAGRSIAPPGLRCRRRRARSAAGRRPAPGSSRRCAPGGPRSRPRATRPPRPASRRRVRAGARTRSPRRAPSGSSCDRLARGASIAATRRGRPPSVHRRRSRCPRGGPAAGRG